MKRRQYLLLVAVTVLAGLIGGAVSNYLLVQKAVAEENPELREARLREIEEVFRRKLERTMSANQFIVTDDLGRTRAVFGMSAAGKPFLTFKDTNSQSRIEIVATDKELHMAFLDNQGKRRLIVELDPEGRPRIKLWDKTGIQRAALGCTNLVKTQTGAVEKLAESSLVLFDVEGMVLRQLP